MMWGKSSQTGQVGSEASDRKVKYNFTSKYILVPEPPPSITRFPSRIILFDSLQAMGLTAVLMIATGDASQKQIHYPKSCSSCPLFHESSRVRQLLEGHVNREARADNLGVVDLERLLEALGNVSHFSHCCGSALTTQSCLWKLHLYQPPWSELILPNFGLTGTLLFGINFEVMFVLVRVNYSSPDFALTYL